MASRNLPQISAVWKANQTQAALYLAHGFTIKAAAEKAEISERTVRGWLDNPAYKSLIGELRGAVLERISGGLVQDAVHARRVLRKLLKDESSAIKLRAATAILDNVLKLREQVDLAAKLAELEAATERVVGSGRGRRSV